MIKIQVCKKNYSGLLFYYKYIKCVPVHFVPLNKSTRQLILSHTFGAYGTKEATTHIKRERIVEVHVVDGVLKNMNILFFLSFD